MSESLRPTYLEVNLPQLRQNVEAIRAKVAPAKVLVMVKANAYGHGVDGVAPYIEPFVDYLGVAILEEGIHLRELGIKKPILVAGGALSEQIPAYLKYDLTLTASSPELLAAPVTVSTTSPTSMRLPGPISRRSRTSAPFTRVPLRLPASWMKKRSSRRTISACRRETLASATCTSQVDERPTRVSGASIFQVTVMLETGAIARVVSGIKTGAPEDKIIQIMIINVGFGTILAALGATPVSILPPIMVALGYSTTVAIALPAIGYDALCTYALLGVAVVVFADVVKGITGREFAPAEVGLYFAQYMPVVTTLIALSMLWLVGGWREVRRGFGVALVTGLTAGFVAIGMNVAGLPTLTGVVAGIAVVLAMLAYLRLRGGRLVDRSLLGAADLDVERGMGSVRTRRAWESTGRAPSRSTSASR